MAKYTFELRELFEPITFNPPIFTRSQVESWFKDYNESDYLTQEQIDVINTAGIWSKDRLATKIVNHYYIRESGLETIGLFKHYVKVTMDEIMEEYLPLIYSASLSYNPLENVNFTETYQRGATNVGSSTSTSSNTASGLVVGSNTPQGEIIKANILAGNYASSTSANENESSIEDETNTTANTIENYTKKIQGNNGSITTSQIMVKEYRDNIRAIDKEIIKKLNILFMGLY